MALYRVHRILAQEDYNLKSETRATTKRGEGGGSSDKQQEKKCSFMLTGTWTSFSRKWDKGIVPKALWRDLKKVRKVTGVLWALPDVKGSKGEWMELFEIKGEF